MYRVIVPDLRGFGQSSSPKEVTAYGSKHITNDLAALLGTLRYVAILICLSCLC